MGLEPTFGDLVEGLAELHPSQQTRHSAATSLQRAGSEGGRRSSERSCTLRSQGKSTGLKPSSVMEEGVG